MKLTLIGYGFVGKAVYNVLKDYHNVKIVDPQYNENVIESFREGPGMHQNGPWNIIHSSGVKYFPPNVHHFYM